MARLVNLSTLQQFTAVNLSSDLGNVGGPVVIPNAVQIRLRWSISAGKLASNILYGRTGGIPAPTVAQAQAIFAALTTGAQWTALAALLSNGVALVAVDIRSVDTANQPFVTSTGALVPGVSATQPLPNEVALAVTLRTALAGIQNRGRLFSTGYTVDALAVGNVASAATVTALGNWATTITGALAAQGYTWSIGHKARAAYQGSTGTQHPARPAGTVPITAAVVRDNHWDTIRRRGLK